MTFLPGPKRSPVLVHREAVQVKDAGSQPLPQQSPGRGLAEAGAWGRGLGPRGHFRRSTVHQCALNWPRHEANPRRSRPCPRCRRPGPAFLPGAHRRRCRAKQWASSSPSGASLRGRANVATMKDGRKLMQRLGELRPGSVYFRTHNLLNTGDGTAAFKWGSTNATTEDAQAGRCTTGPWWTASSTATRNAACAPICRSASCRRRSPAPASTPYQHSWRRALATS